MGLKLAVQSVFSALDRVSGPVTTMGKNVDRFARNADRAGMNLGASWGKLRGIISTVAVAVTTGAAAKALSDFAAKGDEIAKTARMLGFSAEALQELRYAGNIQGVTNEQLTQGMKLLNNQLGQLQAGEGTLYSALKRSNPALAFRLRSVRDTDEAFSILMESIASETNVQKRAMIAQAAFGKSGQELIKFANGGAEAIKSLRAEAQKYGAIISDEAAQKSEEFDDSMTRLNGTFSSAFIPILSQAVARLQPMIQRLADWIAANKELIGQRVDNAINWVVNAAKTAYDIFKKWSPVIIGVGAGIVAMNVAMKAAAVISIVSKAIRVGTAVMAMFRAGASIATVAQWAFNAAVAANPIMLIAIAVAALILGIILLAKNWDKVSRAFQVAGAWIAGTFRTIRDWIYKALDNPVIRTAALIFLPFITIPLLIIKNWDRVKGFFSALWSGIKSGASVVADVLRTVFFMIADVILSTIGNVIKGVMTAVSRIGGALGFDMSAVNSAISSLEHLQKSVREGSAFETAKAEKATPVSPNTSVIASNMTTTRRSQLDVTFANPPPGTAVRQTGSAPDISVNMGSIMNLGVAH